MKALAILALLFGLAAVGSSVYALVETKPNYEASQKWEREGGALGATTAALQEDYQKTLGREVVGAWAAGLLALVLGIVAARSGPTRALGVIAIVLGLAGAGLAFLSMPQPLVL